MHKQETHPSRQGVHCLDQAGWQSRKLTVVGDFKQDSTNMPEIVNLKDYTCTHENVWLGQNVWWF